MAGGREYSRYQKGIINRYYQHRDTLMQQKLGEIVGELVLADSDKARERLWKRAEKALANLAANDARVRTILEERSPEKLAALVNEL
ncbi:MAG: hypothetical protein AAGI30_14560 [Planctomycetota bacterium]